MAAPTKDTSTASSPSHGDLLVHLSSNISDVVSAWDGDQMNRTISTEYFYAIVRMISENYPLISGNSPFLRFQIPTAFETTVLEHKNVHLDTRIRLRRIAQESREHNSEFGVEVEVERRAELLLERVWVSDMGNDEAFRDSTFVTITGDGAVQFEWESGTVAIEAIVEPKGGFTIYVHPEGGEPIEHAPVELADAVAVIAHGWSAGGV